MGNKLNMETANMFTLEEAYQAVAGHDEFPVKIYDGMASFDYIVIFENSFKYTEEEVCQRANYLCEQNGGKVDDYLSQAEKDCKRFAWIRQNFRGVTFNVKTGEMISLPLHKFFNVNQTAETQFILLKDRQAIIYEKMDGSMIHFFIDPQGQLTAATRRSALTPQAKEALRLANQSPSLVEQIVSTIESGWTPIFEFVAPHNQIVVQYPQPMLIYLISRNRATGEYRFDDQFPNKATRYEFKFGDIFDQLDKIEFEGYVCHLLPESELDYVIVKAKTPWYIERHRAVDAMMRPAYKLYQVVFDGLMDDLIAVATENVKPHLERIYHEAQRDFLNEQLRIQNDFEWLVEKLGDDFPLIDQKALTIESLEKEVVSLKSEGQNTKAILRVRDVTGLGLLDSKKFVNEGVWPEGFMVQDEAALEAQRFLTKRSAFAELVKQEKPEDFSVLMALFAEKDPSDEIKSKLMDGYRVKYPNKIFFDMDVEN